MLYIDFNIDYTDIKAKMIAFAIKPLEGSELSQVCKETHQDLNLKINQSKEKVSHILSTAKCARGGGQNIYKGIVYCRIVYWNTIHGKVNTSVTVKACVVSINTIIYTY